MNHWSVTTITTIITLYALFGDDCKLAFFPKSADFTFNLITTLVLILFVLFTIVSLYFLLYLVFLTKKSVLCIYDIHLLNCSCSILLCLDDLKLASMIFDLGDYID